MNKKIQSALISVFYKDGLQEIVQHLDATRVKIYSTGGTQKFIEELGIKVTPVESLTSYPSILSGRVKTLHPAVFGGILGIREDATHQREMKEFNIPEIDLVIIDLYPFEETVASTSDKAAIIEKIDIGGPSLIRAAAKNHKDVTVVAHKKDYPSLLQILKTQNNETTLDQRRNFAIKAFDICTAYDTAISNYFHGLSIKTAFAAGEKKMRYGENPHQAAAFFGNLEEIFDQIHGKELSYNNLVDIDAAMQLLYDVTENILTGEIVFAIFKHTNVCGIAQRKNLLESWQAAIAGDPESAFGGVLICNAPVDKATAEAINEIFFEVLIAPAFDTDALLILQSKKKRILLKNKQPKNPFTKTTSSRSFLNGILLQDADSGNFSDWKEVGGRTSNEDEKADLAFANIVCKHLKSNAIALVKNKQLVGKGCGQTSRIDALRQAIEKARQFHFDLHGAVMASDAFFPFDDSVKLAHENGVTAIIQPGGSIRDKDSIDYCVKNNLAMVLTGMRHFKH